MFLNKTIEENEKLIKTAFQLHRSGEILPDTYLIDVDTLLENAQKIKKAGDSYGIKLYYMTKQFGRNPYIAKELEKMGYDGAVVVDFKEALRLMDNGIKLGHVGHLVQIPNQLMEKVLLGRPEIITIYSLEKAKEISDTCERLGIIQEVMLRVLEEGDNLYPGQYGGFYLEELLPVVKKLMTMKNIKLTGLTSFPCFLFDEGQDSILKTKNVETLKKAKELIEGSFDIKITQMNMPSATSLENIGLISAEGGTHGEPGHSLTGTTPYNSCHKGAEKPAIVYVSEISHNLRDKSYCYGGGHYRRSHMKNALVGKSLEEAKNIKVEAPSLESIDYHFELKEKAEVGETVVMAFRSQIFVTRSTVALVRGISKDAPCIIGFYDAQGRKL